MIGETIVFTGVGDVFAALFLAHSATKSSLAEALEYTIATVQAVLKTTLNAISSDCGMSAIQFFSNKISCLVYRIKLKSFVHFNRSSE